MRVLITGATGFIGQALITRMLAIHDLNLFITLRRHSLDVPGEVTKYIIGEISPHTDWSKALKSIDVVIHLAGRAHIFGEDNNPTDVFKKVNTAATINLANQAITAGVKRFVFISSIGVNGNCNSKPFKETDKVNPQEPYAISKYEAELELLVLKEEYDMEVVIIRPPLVYGPNAPGNFGRLLRWVDRGVPLPFSAINNQRSLVALDNLVSFIIHCIDHPKATNEVFLISDGEDVSTTTLLRKVAAAFDRRALLLPVPVAWMKFVASLVGKRDLATRLFSSLKVDSCKARELLGWKPVTTMDEQLKKIIDTYLNEKNF